MTSSTSPPGSVPPGPAPLDPELLLRHVSWMRQLALRLVGDEHLAEELSQDTLVRALERPPRTDQPLHAWLATVLRNLWRQHRRGSGRRYERERRVARPESLPSQLELVERLSSQRSLAEAVLALDEPYRRTILLRFYEELPPRRIAAEDGLPVSTVKTRIARGLARLRADLQRNTGDVRGLALFLLPILRPTRSQVLAASHALGSSGLVVIGSRLAVTAVVLAGAWGLSRVLRNEDRVPAAPSSAPLSAELAGNPAPPAQALIDLPRSGRQAAPETLAPATSQGADPLGTLADATVRGVVLDAESRPVAGVRIVAVGAEDMRAAPRGNRQAGDVPACRSGSDGRFELSTGSTSGQLVVDDMNWVTLFAARLDAGDNPKDKTLIVAPPIELGGEVIDAHGVTVEGAEVRWSPPAGLRAGFERVLDESIEQHWQTLADESGSFRLARVPWVEGARLEASGSQERPGGSSARTGIPCPARSDLGLLLILPVPSGEEAAIVGRVIDAGGRGVPGARVALGVETVQTGVDGGFRIAGEPREFGLWLRSRIRYPLDTLTAVKPGYLPATQTSERTDEEGHPVWPLFVTLVLDRQPLAIRGRVVRADGTPAPDQRVWIDDPTIFGAISVDARDPYPRLVHVETLIGERDLGWPFVMTDARGQFVLEGLLPRDYRVSVMDPGTLQRIDVADVPGDTTDLFVRHEPGATWPRLRGRAIANDGRPLGGVRVIVMADAFRTRFGGHLLGTHHAYAEANVATTDPEGAFELTNVPRRNVYLRFDGPDTVPLEWTRHEEGGLAARVGDAPRELEIVLSRRAHFRVLLDDPGRADALSVHDAQDEPLEISEFLGLGRDESLRHAIEGGATNFLAVAETAAVLVLHRGELEVGRVPLHLDPDQPTTLRP